ncbi:unnamed protein product [Mytilus edulis]|uniref:WSC domain-containing protein n=1 Tax=Mytilus edulis TaxID=6550 RepID=A0A8S3TE31_MYTED|nr:unnamed protein product [Mytilus edulis]
MGIVTFPGTEKEYIGCYEDQNERTLPYERVDLEGTMNNDICASHCCSTLDGATFSGSEVQYACFCSNVTNTDKFVPRDPATGKDCDMECFGNPNEMCGGSWSLSVYRIDCSTDTTVTSKTFIFSDTSTGTVDYSPTNSDKSQVATTHSPIKREISTVTTTSSPTTSDIFTLTTNALQTTRYLSKVITEITTESPKPANSQSTSENPQLNKKSTVGSDNYVCSCANCLHVNNTVWTEEEIYIRVALLKNAISINKKETSLYKNTKRSAYDSRKSARNVGIVGIILMILPVIFIIVIDILSILTVT